MTRETLEAWVIGAGRASVQVDYVRLTRGGIWQVVAAWHGRGEEPEPGQPDLRSSHQDYYNATSQELARAIAERAVDELKRGDHIDLRRIAAAVKRRHPELQGLTRTADGAVLLGDTPPDEAVPGVRGAAWTNGGNERRKRS